MSVRLRYKTKRTDTEEAYVVCVSDLMAGLLSVFILTLVYYMLNFSQATAQLTENDSKRAGILHSIKDELQQKGIEVKIDSEHGVLRLQEGILFDVGEAEIKQKGRFVVENLALVMYEVLSRPEYTGSVETVFVEGHTDDIPISTNRFPSNWELSTQRAINTWATLTKSEQKLARLENKKQQPLFSCSGYADSRPIRANTSIQERQENRRIDLRFAMTPPTADEANIIRTVRQIIAK